MAGPFLHGIVTWIWLLFAASCVLAEVKGPPRQLEAVEGYKKSRTGRTVKLLCPVSGNPIPLTMWTKDGESINGGWERYRVRPDGLKIKGVVVEDSGHYVCRATNGFGSVSINFTLTVLTDEDWDALGAHVNENPEKTGKSDNGEQVQRKPELQGEHPVNTTVEYGGTASFQCRVRSDTQPHIQWLKKLDRSKIRNVLLNATIDMDGQKLLVLPAGEIWKRPDGSYLNKLMIKSATEADEGMYICLGANNMGYSIKSAFLEVLPATANQGAKNSEDGPIRRNTTVQPSKHVGLNPTKKALLIGLPLGFGFVFCLAAIVCTYNCNRSQGNGPVHHPPPNQLSNHLAKKSNIHDSRNGLPNGSGYHNGSTGYPNGSTVYPNGSTVLSNGYPNSHHSTHSHHSDCEQSMPLTGQVPGQNSLQTFPINSSRETALNRYEYIDYAPSYTDTLNSDRSRGSSRLHSHHSSHLHHPHHMLHHGSNSLVHHC